MAMVKLVIASGTRSDVPVVFANARQALTWADNNRPEVGRYASRWLAETETRQAIEATRVGPLTLDELELLEHLYPTCEHGLSLTLCSGPGHYPQDRPEDDFPDRY